MEDVIEKSITLYSRKDGADKVYSLQINKVGEGEFLVLYANARRGSALKPKRKTDEPVSFDEANNIYLDKLKEQLKPRKGYTENPDGILLQNSANTGRPSGVEFQLLTVVHALGEAVALCNDDRYAAQLKHDGERRPVEVKNKVIEGINKHGEYTGLIKEIADGINPEVNMVVDTEDMSTYLAAFDLLEYDNEDLRPLGFQERYNRLVEIASLSNSIRVSKVAFTTKEKLELLNSIDEKDLEGMVFKLIDAPSQTGKDKGGSQIKFKFYAEASVIVVKRNVQRSVQVAVLDDDGNRVNVGNVTIPANVDMPVENDLIEVKYLYAYRGGCLFTASFNKPRPDQRMNECLQSQLKYKADPDSVSEFQLI